MRVCAREKKRLFECVKVCVSVRERERECEREREKKIINAREMK